MQVNVRTMQQRDALAVAKMEQACFAEAWDLRSIGATLARRDFCGVIVEADGEAVCYVLGTVLFEDAEVLRIATVPSMRKQGVGAAALDAFLALVKEKQAERVFLEVRVSNAAAIALYTSCGFDFGRVREHYYSDGESAVEMAKTL